LSWKIAFSPRHLEVRGVLLAALVAQFARGRLTYPGVCSLVLAAVLEVSRHSGANHCDGGSTVNSILGPSVMGNALKMWAFTIQDYSLLAFHSVRNIFTDKHYFANLVEQMDVIGVGSLRIVVVALLCVGGAVVLNAAAQFSRFGEAVLTGDAVSLALLRELGPVFTALLIAGRNATAMASELGSMVVTEQVDAMRGFGIDPVRRLMTPRVLATVLVLPLLVAVGDCAGLLGGFLVASLTLHLSAEQFWTRAIHALVFGDLCIGFTKPIVFGFIIATVGCYQGLRVKGGTEGVGQATIAAFVESSVIVLIVDLFLTRLLLYTFNL
jgi:phospholipid/cholesterol/gamma-HCH transport system permease protein